MTLPEPSSLFSPQFLGDNFLKWVSKQEHITNIFIPGNRITHYLMIVSIPISALVSLKWEWLEDSHRNESLLPRLGSSLYPSPYCSFFFLILLTPSIIAVGQWMEEDIDLPRTGAESLGEVISSKIHSLAGGLCLFTLLTSGVAAWMAHVKP